jgi:hypothetical protein
MKEHIIPSIIASLVASGAAVGAVHMLHKPVIVNAHVTDAKPLTDAKAAQLAKSVWPEMEQANIDKLTELVKAFPGSDHRVTIYCVEDTKCGDLALNLDNVFESAHWKSDIIDYPMIPPGLLTGSADLLIAMKQAGFPDVKLDPAVRAVSGDAIAIGNRYTP